MSLLTETTIDVRNMPPRERHPTIFDTWNELPSGQAILLVNDHDPVPLYYQFACESAGEFHWEYLESGPSVWKVRIQKGDFPDPGFVPTRKASCAVTAPVQFQEPLVLDVRPIFARGGSPCGDIDAAVASLAPRRSLILLVPFEPKPLYGKLAHQGFTHNATQLEDGTWRIEFRPGQ